MADELHSLGNLLRQRALVDAMQSTEHGRHRHSI
jgi:hypothetical protein